MTPIAPKLKELEKLHKEARLMRPLVNRIQSPCYKIAKIVAEFLKKNFRFETRHNIRDKLEHKEGINKLNIKRNDKLISLDVMSLICLEKYEKTTAQHEHPEGLECVKIVEEIMDQNY